MKDFTREELAEWRDLVQAHSATGAKVHATFVDDLLCLLDMASRSVSVETVRKLAEYDAAPLTGDETRRAAGEFAMAAARDLRPSGEGKDGL